MKFRERMEQVLRDDGMLDNRATAAGAMKETARNVFGMISGQRKEDKMEIWLWNEEIQQSIRRKRLAEELKKVDRSTRRCGAR